MRSRPYELQLPFDDGAVTGLARQRIDHLRALGGVEPTELVRLARGFPSLRDIYAATEAELASVVGAVAAARIRWFLDAPLDTRLAVEPDTPASVTLRTAA
jgi:ERCC4-type nuclease